jgi:hypothetical protein
VPGFSLISKFAIGNIIWPFSTFWGETMLKLREVKMRKRKETERQRKHSWKYEQKQIEKQTKRRKKIFRLGKWLKQ